MWTPSLSDASTLAIERAEPANDTSFILKRAVSANGRLALEQEYACLLRIRGNHALNSAWGDLLPEALHFENVAEEASLLMSRLPGSDARTTAGSPERLAPLLASAVITCSQKAMFDAMGLLLQGALEEIERRLISSPDLDLVFANKDATILTLRQP